METKITRHRVGTIEEFADEYGLVMLVEETDDPAESGRRFLAKFSECYAQRKIADMWIPWVGSGAGNTPEAAKKAYAGEISCQKIFCEGATEGIPVWRLDEPAEAPTHTFENEIPKITIEATDKGFLKRLTAFLVIAPCPSCGCEVSCNRKYDDTCRVQCASPRGAYGCVFGPERPTEAEAIAAWNSFARKA